MGSVIGCMFRLDCQSIADTAAITGDVWHQWLGHVNQQTLIPMNTDKGDGLSFCDPCVQGKLARRSYDLTGDIRTTPRLELVHSDVCTMETESLAESKYFVTFIDDFAGSTAVNLIKKKSEVLDKSKEYQARVGGERIGALRSDRGGEYMSQE